MRLMQRPLLPLADLCKNLDFAHALDLGNQLLLCESSQEQLCDQALACGSLCDA